MLRSFFDTALGKGVGGRKVVALCLGLVAITLAVYIQAGNHTFFILDENDHVTQNVYVESGLTAGSILWAFKSVAAFNWHPITWLSHMTIAEFYGMSPRAHHLANVVIHTISSVVLFLLFLRLTGAVWQCLFVAALFALHPLHVESVAWVAERKDVLSAFFWFLTLYSYSGYVMNNRKPSRYVLTLIFFVLGIMSKSMLVTLPIVMLLMDFWPLDRYRSESLEQRAGFLTGRVAMLVKEKIPFFVCSFVVGLVTIYAQHTGGATKSFDAVPLMFRIQNALVAYVKYGIKTLYPVDLGVLYPMPSSFPLWQVIGSLLVLLFVSAAAVCYGRRYPYLPVGWFWFIVTTLPVIGLIQVGSQSMADRYTYIPIIGLFIIAAWGGADLTRGMRQQKITVALVACLIMIASAALTWRQLGYWRDSISILRHTLQVTSNNYLVNDLLGLTFAKNGDLDAALQEYQTAVRINPGDSKTRTNLGIVLSAKGDLEAAIRELQVALRISPGDAKIRALLGDTLAEKGDLDAAILEYQESLRIRPDNSHVQDRLTRVIDQKRLEKQ